MAKITCGVNAADNASFNGMTIAQVMEQYGQFFNIPKDNLVILVNDEEESDHSYMIQSDDEVEFVKSAGEKGRNKFLHPEKIHSYLPYRFNTADAGSGKSKQRNSTQPMSLKEIRKENVKRRNCRFAH